MGSPNRILAGSANRILRGSANWIRILAALHVRLLTTLIVLLCAGSANRIPRGSANRIRSTPAWLVLLATILWASGCARQLPAWPPSGALFCVKLADGLAARNDGPARSPTNCPATNCAATWTNHQRSALSSGPWAETEEKPMANWRVEMHRVEELVRLHRMKVGPREAARILKMGPNIERKYRKALQAEGLLDGSVEELPALDVLRAAVEKHYPAPNQPAHQRSSLEPYRDAIESHVKNELGPRAIFDRLRLEHAPFGGTYSSLKRFCRALRRAQGVRAVDVAIPVETAPGEIAQVDFGYVGRLYDSQAGTLRKAWCFVMVLGYSRHMYACVVFDQKVETWLALHTEAFSRLGGVVETVVPDNLKAAVVRAAFGADEATELNRSYRELAKHYGFKVDPTPPRAPTKKGKVEAGVKYVKNNFFAGRQGAPIDEVQRDLSRWVQEIAGKRVHGTTGKRPLEEFDEIERSALRPLPRVQFEPVVWKKATVHRDSHVAFGKRLYSVPWKLIGKQVWIQASARSLIVYADDARVATHGRRGSGPRSTVDEHLPDYRANLRHRSREYWEQRASAMGDDVAVLVKEVFDADDVLSQLRTVQAIVTHLEKFPIERARAACRRARHFGSHGYSAIKNILNRGLDFEPLPDAVRAPLASNDQPRFARPASTWLMRVKEVSHESHG